MITPRQTLALATTLLALGIMSGCATMNADECRNADWRIVGYEDGLQGAGGTGSASTGKPAPSMA